MRRIVEFWREGVALLAGIAVGVIGEGVAFALIATAFTECLLRGLTLVPDNRARVLLRAGRLQSVAGPGPRVCPWPLFRWGEWINLEAQPAEARMEGVESSDRVPFEVRLRFLHRFNPWAVRGQPLLAELIERDEDGRRAAAEYWAQVIADSVVRQRSHFELLSGLEQITAQQQIQQDLMARLEAIGIQVVEGSLRVTFHAPADLQRVFVEQQMTRPQVARLAEYLDAVRRYASPEIRHYIDLQMAEALSQQRTDPAMALLAREWLLSNDRRHDQPRNGGDRGDPHRP